MRHDSHLRRYMSFHLFPLVLLLLYFFHSFLIPPPPPTSSSSSSSSSSFSSSSFSSSSSIPYSFLFPPFYSIFPLLFPVVLYLRITLVYLILMDILRTVPTSQEPTSLTLSTTATSLGPFPACHR